ncbi:MAG: methionine adenosyltransferase [Leptospiraceae bacterium]|nr:methionine adenosyltransferase [Leptospiraceae bacterium]
MFENREHVFTSESVSEGHPDKICDQISDAILDAYLKNDPASRVACETLTTTNHVTVAGEVSSNTLLKRKDIADIARKVIREIGYTETVEDMKLSEAERIGFTDEDVQINVLLHSQSNDIAQGVIGEGLHKEEGAGDQGMMFGFAIDETEALMPMPIYYSHKLLENLAQLRKSGKLDFLRPDAKSQVTVRYQDGKPLAIDTIVISTQHTPDVSHRQISDSVIEECVKTVIPAELLKNTEYHINPTGRFVVGGPHGDCGLTGRKIIVDTYGGYARHGGGAFSGKDPSKVDRSAAYMMRYVAKNVVASGIAKMCEIQVAYAIGVAKPVSVVVNTFGTGKVADDKIEQMIAANFDLTPKGIRETLGLRNIQYQPTASYGHFGRQGSSFPWEKTDKTAAFQK